MSIPPRLRTGGDGRRIGTVDDVAAVLGLPISSTYALIRAGRVPGVLRIGRRIRVDMDKLDHWIEANSDDAGATTQSDSK